MGVRIEVYKNKNGNSMTNNSKPKNNNIIINEIKTYKQAFYSIWIFTAIINILMLAPSIYMLQVYDRVLASNNKMTLLMLTLLVICIYLFIGLLEWVRNLIVIRISTRLDLSVNQSVFNAAYEQSLKYSDPQASQALSDLTTLRQFVTGNALFALFDAPWFLFFLCVVFILHPWLGYLALGGTTFISLLAWLNQRYTRKPLTEANQTACKAINQASSHLRNADVIEAMGMLGNIRRHWLSYHHAFLSHQNLASERTSATRAWSKTARLMLQSLILGMGAWLVTNNELTAGMMIASSILVGRVLSPIDQLIAVSKQYNSAKQAYQRLDHLFNQHPARKQVMVLPATTGELSVENVLYRPDPAYPPLLYDIQFSLSAGQTLGIIGVSGAGKSTLARILVGALPPTLGYIRLDGANIYQMDREILGPHIGYLPQDIQLFDGTIAENIARFGEIDVDKVITAAKIARVHDLILTLPNGYDTQLGEYGRGLSGGQKQRLALARAVYDLPRLIILDEPNSNLDSEGDKALCLAIEEFKRQHCTLIIITHRPFLIRYVENVLILHPGMSPRFGTPQTLLNQEKTSQLTT